MTNDPATVLLALQFGDSAFPSGGFAFSWGLEGLAADGMIASAADVEEIAGHQLTHRWNKMDRVLLARAYAAEQLEAAIAVDRLAEAATLSEPMRVGSRRAGRALLGVCARLGQPATIRYHQAAQQDALLGHLSVIQGIAFKAAGLPSDMAALLGGWAVVNGLTSAAVRLGLIGHVEALEIATALRATLAELLAAPVKKDAGISSFTPIVDVAIARNTRRDMRMFAT